MFTIIINGFLPLTLSQKWNTFFLALTSLETMWDNVTRQLNKTGGSCFNVAKHHPDFRLHPCNKTQSRVQQTRIWCSSRFSWANLPPQLSWGEKTFLLLLVHYSKIYLSDLTTSARLLHSHLTFECRFAQEGNCGFCSTLRMQNPFNEGGRKKSKRYSTMCVGFKINGDVSSEPRILKYRSQPDYVLAW